VLGIEPGSPADYASLRTGDLLIAAAGRRFDALDDLSDALEQADGSLLTIEFRRGGDTKKREVAIRLIRGLAA
jgi:S1-C subfamily serine protease